MVTSTPRMPRFKKRRIDLEEEFTFMKEDQERVKAVIHEKLLD